MRTIALALLATIGATAPAAAAVTGYASVLEGDVLSVNGQLFRVFGVDAVETHQFCYVDGKPWACGPAAIRTLEIMVGPEPVTCTETGESAGTLGAWARCTVGGRDIAEAMVKAGMAVALRDQSADYAAAEDAARAALTGIWRSNFVPPWEFREDIAAIEGQVNERLRADVPGRFEAALLASEGGFDMFRDVEVRRGGEAPIPGEFVLTDLAPGFLLQSIQGDVFDWRQPARAMTEWQATVTAAARNDSRGRVWADLAARATDPPIVLTGEERYYEEIRKAAAPIIAAGRQPVLMVAGMNNPSWIIGWFTTTPPQGAVVTKRESMPSGYVGTIDGIDVYTGKTREAESMIFPGDMLVAVNFGVGADGKLVTSTFQPGTIGEPGTMTLRYAQGMEWKDDDIVVLKYPFEAVVDEYE